MHMMKKHAEIGSSEDSNEVTMAINQLQCEICEFKCQWNKSLQMHMMKKNVKI